MTFGVASGVLWEQVDTRVMLIDSASSELVTLNPVGSRVWHALAERPMTVAELAQAVVEAFPGVSVAQATADVEGFVEELLRIGLVSAEA